MWLYVDVCDGFDGEVVVLVLGIILLEDFLEDLEEEGVIEFVDGEGAFDFIINFELFLCDLDLCGYKLQICDFIDLE